MISICCLFLSENSFNDSTRIILYFSLSFSFSFAWQSFSNRIQACLYCLLSSCACSHHKVIKIWFIEWNLFLHMCHIMTFFISLLLACMHVWCLAQEKSHKQAQYYTPLKRWKFNFIFIATSCCCASKGRMKERERDEKITRRRRCTCEIEDDCVYAYCTWLYHF